MTAAPITGRGIVTPQGLVLDLESAGLGYRTVARLIDIVVALTLLSAISVLASLLGETAEVVTVVVSGFVVIFVIPAVAETWFRGRTFGKFALGLRVVTLEAGPIGFREAAIRSLFQLVDIISSFGVAAAWCVTVTERSQTIGDMVAGTFVVRDPRSRAHVPAVPFTPPIGFEGLVQEMDVRGLTPDTELLIRSYLLRSNELHQDAAAELAFRIQSVAATELGHDPRPFVHPNIYLASVLAAHQMRSGGLVALALAGEQAR